MFKVREEKCNDELAGQQLIEICYLSRKAAIVDPGKWRKESFWSMVPEDDGLYEEYANRPTLIFFWQQQNLRQDGLLIP